MLWSFLDSEAYSTSPMSGEHEPLGRGGLTFVTINGTKRTLYCRKKNMVSISGTVAAFPKNLGKPNSAAFKKSDKITIYQTFQRSSKY